MTTRPLDPTEVYYEVVDRMWPMNALGVIELDRVYDHEQVTAAWTTITDQVPIVGARVVREGPREAHFDFSARVMGPITAYDDELAMLAAVSDERISLDGPLVRCASAPGMSGGTAFAVTAHHVALDGRPMAQLLFLLARVLVDGDDITGHPLTAPTEPLGRYTLPERDWSARRSEMLTTAREIRDEEAYVGNGDVPEWYDRALDRPRDLAYTIFDLTTEESQALLAWSKASGATVHGALTAVVVKAIAHLTPAMKRVPLSTTVDLRVRAAAPAVDVVGQSAAVVSTSFDASVETAALARRGHRRHPPTGRPQRARALLRLQRRGEAAGGRGDGQGRPAVDGDGHAGRQPQQPRGGHRRGSVLGAQGVCLTGPDAQPGPLRHDHHVPRPGHLHLQLRPQPTVDLAGAVHRDPACRSGRAHRISSRP